MNCTYFFLSFKSPFELVPDGLVVLAKGKPNNQKSRGVDENARPQVPSQLAQESVTLDQLIRKIALFLFWVNIKFWHIFPCLLNDR